MTVILLMALLDDSSFNFGKMFKAIQKEKEALALGIKNDVMAGKCNRFTILIQLDIFARTLTTQHQLLTMAVR